MTQATIQCLLDELLLSISETCKELKIQLAHAMDLSEIWLLYTKQVNRAVMIKGQATKIWVGIRWPWATSFQTWTSQLTLSSKAASLRRSAKLRILLKIQWLTRRRNRCWLLNLTRLEAHPWSRLSLIWKRCFSEKITSLIIRIAVARQLSWLSLTKGKIVAEIKLTKTQFNWISNCTFRTKQKLWMQVAKESRFHQCRQIVETKWALRLGVKRQATPLMDWESFKWFQD